MYNKLLTKCSPAKALDPLLVLPLELVEVVLQHLSFNNIVYYGVIYRADRNEINADIL